jgi:hypothetical protein
MDFVLELQVVEADEDSLPAMGPQLSQLASLIPLFCTPE